MIFVTLGTQDMPFERFLKIIERYLIKYQINEPVIVQSGVTQYHTSLMTCIPYLDKTMYNQYLNEASIIFTHGGAGSLFEALKLQKKVIALARLKCYNEHNDDHQEELVNKLVSLGHIIQMPESIEGLQESITQFTPIPYHSTNQIDSILTTFIETKKN